MPHLTDADAASMLANIVRRQGPGWDPTWFNWGDDTVKELVEDLVAARAEAARFAVASAPVQIELDNHHNALLCPHCNPRGLRFAEPDAPAVTAAAKVLIDAFTFDADVGNDLGCSIELRAARDVLKAALAQES